MAWYITATAQRHLEKAIIETHDKWGVKQAKKYHTELLAGFQHIANKGIISRNLHQEQLAFGTEFFIYLCAHRYIVYKKYKEQDIIIMAIFHATMDIPKALKSIEDDHLS